MTENNEAVKLQDYHIVSSTGAPFKRASDAKTSMSKRKLDPKAYSIVELMDGRFALEPVKGNPKKAKAVTEGLPVFEPKVEPEKKEEPAKSAEEVEIENLIARHFTAKEAGDINELEVTGNLLGRMNVVVKETPEGIFWEKTPETSPTQPIDLPEFRHIKRAPPNKPLVSQQAQAKEAEPIIEKYYEVTFNMRQSEIETEDVSLSVNGETLILQRGQRLILPGRYKEAADHATFTKYIQEPGKDRKTAGTIQTYPYMLHGEASKEDYERALFAGTKITKENVHRYGFHGTPPEQGAL